MFHCQYFERSEKIGSCIFSYNCIDECLYKYKHDSEFVEGLARDNESLRNELLYATNNDNEIESLESEHDEAEARYEAAIELCKYLLLNRDTDLKEVENEIRFTYDNILYEDNLELLNIVKKLGENKDEG